MKVYGHEKNIKTLFSIAQNKKLSPALLFSGPSSVGKKQTALLLSQFLLCASDKKPCGTCSSCLNIENTQHDSLLLIEPEGDSIKVEILNKIRSFIKLQSFSPCRIIIIDQAHSMNFHTQNALLKLLEEPPKNIHIILICDKVDMLLKTILSRVTRFRFHPLSLSDMKHILPDKTEPQLLASRGQLDRVYQWEGEEELLKEATHFWQHLLNKKRISKNLYNKLKERNKACLVAQLWQEILRDTRVYQEGSNDWIYPNQKELYKNLSQIPHQHIDSLYKKTLELEQDVRSYVNSTLCFENYWHQAYKALHGRPL